MRAALTGAKARRAAREAARKEAAAARERRAAEAAERAFARARAETNAAIFLQSRVKGMFARGRYQRDRGAVIAAQMCVRRWALRRKRSRLEAKRLAAEDAARVAERARERANAEANAATMIQAAARGLRARGVFCKEKAAVINAQMAVKRWLLRLRCARVKEARVEAERAAAEAAANAAAKAEAHAATFIQSQARGIMARGRYAKERAAIISVQMCARRWVLRRKWRRLEAARLAAQAAAAEAAAARAKAEESAREHAATFIQTRIRGSAARQNYSTLRAAIISVQMCARRWVLRRKWRRLEAARLEAARIAAEEEEAAREAQAQLHAATFIQSHVRGKLARGQYSAERAAVIRAQMAVRRWVLRVKWTGAREAREEAERVAAEAAKAKAERHAAVLIQSRVRGAAARERYAKMIMPLQRALELAYEETAVSSESPRRSLGAPLRGTLDDSSPSNLLRAKEDAMRNKLRGKLSNALSADDNSPGALLRAREEALRSPNLRGKLREDISGHRSPAIIDGGRSALERAREEALAELPSPARKKKRSSFFSRVFSPNRKTPQKRDTP